MKEIIKKPANGKMNSYYSMGQWFEANLDVVDRRIKTKHDPCMFYHISSEPLTPLDYDERSFVMHPRYIESGESDIEDVMRICVAPTVEQCILATVAKADPQFYIYRTTRRSTETYLPFGVLDSPLTQERWFRSKRTFKLVGIVPANQYYIYDISERCRTEYLSDFRGSQSSFHVQHRELHRLRKFFKKHESGFFFNEKETMIHRNQRNIIQNINRGELRSLIDQPEHA